MIFILITILLCFTSYRNKLFKKLVKVKELFTEEEENKSDKESNKKKDEIIQKKKSSKSIIKNYPVSGNVSSTIDNRITSTGTNSVDDVRFIKLKHLLKIVALKGRKQIIIKSLSNKDINYTLPIKFNQKNLPMKEKKVYPNEIKPIMDYILDQINSTKLRNDDTYHKLRLIQLDENDVLRQETKDEVKYDIGFIVKYYSNFFNNVKNKKISKIDDLIINCEIIGKKEYLDDIFITSLKAGKNVKLIINQLEISGIFSKNNYLTGYEQKDNSYKLLDNFSTNKSRDYVIPKPKKIAYDYDDDHNYINLQNYNPNKKSMVKINSNYKEKKNEEKSYFDSIESLLPDSYREPGTNNNLLTEDSDNLIPDDVANNLTIEEQEQIDQEEEEEYELDSANMTSNEDIVIRPDQIIIN